MGVGGTPGAEVGEGKAFGPLQHVGEPHVPLRGRLLLGLSSAASTASVQVVELQAVLQITSPSGSSSPCYPVHQTFTEHRTLLQVFRNEHDRSAALQGLPF